MAMGWLRVVLAMAAACLLAVAQGAVISDDVVGTGDGNFNFEILGQLCFRAGVSTVNVRTSAITAGENPTGKLVLFTQATLHHLFDKQTNCEFQEVLGECVDLGQGDCTSTLPLGGDETFTYTAVSTTELFFVVWDCDASDRVDVDFTITSFDAEECSALREDPDATGFAVTVVLLCVINLGLVVLTMVFWKRKEQLASIEI